jgi:polyisoprenoid-binding protein YceI
MRTDSSIVAVVLVTLASVAVAGGGSTKAYDFRDPKSLNTVIVVLDSPLEPMVGLANGVSGDLTFDPSAPQASRGRIVVDAASVQFSNPGLAATARGPDGFDVEHFPTIEFVVRELRRVRPAGSGVYAANAIGDFTCRGTTKRITVEATLTHLPGKAAVRHHGTGDLVVLRSTFKIRRRDFGIQPRNGDSLLAEEAEVRVAIAGASP